MPDLFAALARKRLDREQLKGKVRLVLAEKENDEVTKAWAEKEIALAEKATAQAEKATAQAELQVAILRFRAKTMEALRLARWGGVSLRGAVGKWRGKSTMCRSNSTRPS